MQVMEKMTCVTSTATSIFNEYGEAMLFSTPTHLGFPEGGVLSAYYVGNNVVTQNDLNELEPFLASVRMRTRNTRRSKSRNAERTIFDVLVASAETEDLTQLGFLKSGSEVTATKGDHAAELKKIIAELHLASKSTTNPLRKEFLSYYCDFFRKGDFTLFDNAQKIWMKDKRPVVEAFFRFNYMYRDSAGARAEFQAFVGTPVRGSCMSWRAMHGSTSRRCRGLRLKQRMPTTVHSRWTTFKPQISTPSMVVTLRFSVSIDFS
jgi:dipeptidyl-peptidase-3